MKKLGSLQASRLWAGLLLLLSACTRSASTQPAALPSHPTPDQWAVAVQSVQIIPNAGIEITGSAALPAGACVQTRLIENDQPVPWWPQATCITPDAQQQWQLVVPLGRKGAPAALDTLAKYTIQAWWPEQPQAVQSSFPLDLTPPP